MRFESVTLSSSATFSLVLRCNLTSINLCIGLLILFKFLMNMVPISACFFVYIFYIFNFPAKGLFLLTLIYFLSSPKEIEYFNALLCYSWKPNGWVLNLSVSIRGPQTTAHESHLTHVMFLYDMWAESVFLHF